ncbi:unnamed protein product [Rhizoctonia solani]|uniref:DUF4211 domain-containing protein n=1 Tax=Rhizoctonia solani TaxID=456999 RepID=A0A8H3AZ22_9AGAM|nr:unnamed protein product [Rhizoctonia solani]
MPPKPLPRISSSPPIVVLDSDSDEPKPDVKRATVVATRGAKREFKGKWQTTLVDFATLNKKTMASAVPASGPSPGTVKVDTRARTRTQPHSSPVRRRARLSLVKPSTSSATKAHSSPIKAKPDSDGDISQDEGASEDGAPSTDADVGIVQFEKGDALGKKPSRVITSDEDEEAGEEKTSVSSDQEVNPITEDESEEEDIAPRRVVKRKAVAVSLSDLEESDVAPRRRLARRQPAKEENLSDPEEDDDPMDGLDDQAVLDSRLRTAPQRNNKKMEMRETLARLKRRKLGHDTPPVESSSSDEEEEEADVVRPRGRRVYKLIPGARPSQPKLQDWFDGSVEDEPQVVVSRSPSPAKDEDQEESDNDSWIEDDLDNGAPPAILPEGYSMLGHQSLAHQFKVVMQFFVHLACLKAKQRLEFRQEERNDQYFGLALRALRRKMDGLRDSLVTSSKWTSGFKKALNTHPELHIHDLEFAVRGCGACRISNRLSTFKGALSGDDYDRDTFEPINRRSESVDSDESDSEEVKTTFDLGRFCQARVRSYHNFVHWEWQLFELATDEIEILRTAHRRKDPGPGRGQRPAANDPDGIMNWLEGRGIVQQEWARLERLMDGARGLEYKMDD